MSYIGQTKQHLGTRVKQHKYSCQAKNVLKTEKTALASHRFDLGHNFNFTGTKILDTETNYSKRTISEMISIELADNTVNLRTDTDNLSNIYKGVLHNYKKKILA